MVFERGAVASRAEDLVERGAVGGVQPGAAAGQRASRDFSNCGNRASTSAAATAISSRTVLDRAAVAGAADKVRVQPDAEDRDADGPEGGERRRGDPRAERRGDHPQRARRRMVRRRRRQRRRPGGDLALARHFAKPENRPDRTLVFVASAGHHSPGMNGPRDFIAANPDLAKRAVMMVNIEHVAQRNFSPARSTAADGYRQAIADSGEAPIYAGITNRSPFLDGLFQQGVARYGTNFVSEKSNMASGETGGYSTLKARRSSPSCRRRRSITRPARSPTSSRRPASSAWRGSWRSSSRRSARPRASSLFLDPERHGADGDTEKCNTRSHEDSEERTEKNACSVRPRPAWAVARSRSSPCRLRGSASPC